MVSSLDNKKIAYLNFSKYPARNIEKKILAMAKGADAAGIRNIDFLYLAGENRDSCERVKFLRFPNKYRLLPYYQFFFSRYKLIEQSAELEKYDYIILRYCGGDPSGLEFFINHNIISEHHTLEIPEFTSHLNAGMPFHEKLFKKLRLNLEQKYGHQMLRQAKGIIGVTREIADYEVHRAGKKINATTIPNGITVSHIQQSGFKKFDGKNLDLVVLASLFDPWHGFDRLIRAIRRYKGPVDIRVHIVGNISRNDLSIDLKNINITFHGYLAGQQLDAILSRMNLGIGTLCLFRKGMEDACSLKVREYTARGLPFITACNDPDLQDVEDGFHFFMKFSNDDSLIDMNRVIDFVNEGSGVGNLSGYMRDYAMRHMDWSAKMTQYSQFVQHVSKLDQT